MSRLVLYRAFGSPPARAALMCCKTLGLPVEIREVNVLKRENQTAQFKKLNPMGTVPVLQDGDFVLSESHAIMKYLVRAYGGAHKEALYPSELRTRALVDQAMYFDAGVLFKAMINTVMGAFRGELSGLTEQNRLDIEAAYSVIEAYLQGRKYIAADWLTLADLSAGSTTTALQGMHKIYPDKFPRCADWLARLEEEQVFKEVNAPGVAFLTKLLHGLWEKNRIQNKGNTLYILVFNLHA